MKEDLTEDKNEQEIEAYDNLEENLMDINLKIVAEIANDEYYLVEKTTRRLTHKLEKMKISKYKGEFLKYHNWSNQFLTYTDGLDDVTKRAYLIDALEDKAKEFVKDLIDSEADYEELWNKLKRYFGNKKYIQDDVIKSFFQLEGPTEDSESVYDNFVSSRNRGARILQLNLETSQLLAALYVLGLPTTLRIELEQRISNDNNIKEKRKYTHEDLESIILEMVRIKSIAKGVQSATKIRTMVSVVDIDKHKEVKTLNNHQSVKDQKIKMMKEAHTQTTKNTFVLRK